MIWRDKISDIIAAITAQAVFSPNRTTTGTTLVLRVFNQAQDWLCMQKPWRDLKVDTVLTLDSDKKITLPDDYGMCLKVYADPSGIGMPSYFYELNNIDITRRYTEEVTIDSDTGIRTIKLVFPSTPTISSDIHVEYCKVLDDITQAEIDAGTKVSFFPINIMLVTAKMILQDYYGVAGNQDISWLRTRLNEEIKALQGYAISNNIPLDLQQRDIYGQPIFISGMAMDGSRAVSGSSPYLPSTLFTGGV